MIGRREPDWGGLRARMVERQLRGRGIADERVLAAMGRVPREAFVPVEVASYAYDDAALPIGEDQTISQPFIVATMCELLELEGGESVLDVGTGSGYAAAVLDELAGSVVSVERIPVLAARARRALELTGHGDVDVRIGDGSLGAPDRAPFDAISVAAATEHVPPALYEQLAPGGRIVVPVGGAAGSGSCGSSAGRQGRSRRAHSPAASSPSSEASPRPRGPRRPLRSAGEMDEGTATTARELPRGRVDAALRRRANWEQLVKFCVVGATGYVVNLVVYTLLLKQAGLHYTAAAIGSFLVAVTNNYAWNRLWTFRGQRGHVVFQGLRFLVVSTMALGANLVVLHLLVQAGLGEIVAQALAIMLVTPVNFVGNKLWSFRHRR